MKRLQKGQNKEQRKGQRKKKEARSKEEQAEDKREVQRRDGFCSSRDLISRRSSPGALQPLLGVTLCSGAEPLEMHGPCQSRGAPEPPC